MGKKKKTLEHQLTLTDEENYVAWRVLDRVNDNLSLDRESGEYTENHEDFILSLTRSEKCALKRLLEKLI